MTRMSGYDAFLKIADIREDFLDEAYLPVLFPEVKPEPKKKLLAPLWGFFSSHAAAAALCGVLAMGVIAVGVGLSPLNPFRDPAITEPPATDTSEPDEASTIGEDESESESESDGESTAETYAESESADGTETEAEEISGPYELVYTSNGDGTCRISDIRINPRHREAFTLTLPALSPEGERVVSVENPDGFGYGNVPYLLLPEDFEALTERLRAHFGEGEDDYTVWFFNNYYYFRSLSDCETEEQKERLLAKYPWAAVTDFYILDELIVQEVTVPKLSEWIAEAAPDYVAYGAERRLYELAASHGYTLTWYFEPFTSRMAREECRFVESIVLEEGITAIGDGAFRGACAANLTLPQGLTHIGARAFYNCSALAQITWPADGSLKSIGERAFSGCSGLSELHLTGDGLELGAYAFAYSHVQNVTLGAGVTSVGELAFFGCYRLENLHIGSDVTYVGPEALREAGGGPYGTAIRITFDEVCGLTALSEQAFCSTLRDTVLPTSITRIEASAFYGGEIGYAGTVAEWEAIEKVGKLSYDPLTVHCADGDVTYDPKKN